VFGTNSPRVSSPLDAKGRESLLKVDAHGPVLALHGVWHVLCMHMQASETGL